MAEAAANFEANRPEDLEEAKKQIAALQKLITTISRYESELAKMRKDSEARDRQQREVRVRAAKARAVISSTVPLPPMERYLGAAAGSALAQAL